MTLFPEEVEFKGYLLLSLLLDDPFNPCIILTKEMSIREMSIDEETLFELSKANKEIVIMIVSESQAPSIISVDKETGEAVTNSINKDELTEIIERIGPPDSFTCFTEDMAETILLLHNQFLSLMSEIVNIIQKDKIIQKDIDDLEAHLNSVYRATVERCKEALPKLFAKKLSHRNETVEMILILYREKHPLVHEVFSTIYSLDLS